MGSLSGEHSWLERRLCDEMTTNVCTNEFFDILGKWERSLDPLITRKIDGEFPRVARAEFTLSPNHLQFTRD
jgi:hypothetical protein